MNIAKMKYWLLSLVLALYGCAGGDSSFDKEQYPGEEYVRVEVASGCGYNDATDDVEVSRVAMEDVYGYGQLPIMWESVGIDSEQTRRLSLILSDGEKPVLGYTSPEVRATVSYSGLAVAPQPGDAHHADFTSVLYYNSEELNNALYCYALAGEAPINEDVESGRHVCHLRMPSVFTQNNSKNPDFLQNYLYMYATAAYKGQGTILDFNHIPATFRFVITNSAGRNINLQNASIRLADGGSVAAKSANISFDWMNGGVRVSLSESGYDEVAVKMGNGTSLADGEKYIAYALAMPMPNDKAFEGKTINFCIKSDDDEVVALSLDAARLAEINGSGICNWVSGKSYTLRINIRENGRATGEIIEDNRVEVTPSESGIYTLRYEDANGEPLADYAEVCTLTVKEIGYYEDFIAENIAPREAECIGIYNSLGERQGSIELAAFKPDYTEEPLYRFGVLSDVHIGRAEITPDVDLERAIKFLEKRGVSNICICGDLTQNGKEAEFADFADVADLANVPIYATSGNHDATKNGITPDLWERYISRPLVYERTVEVNGKRDHFLFLGMERWNFSAAYYEYHLAWLESKLEAYRNERCFIFTHLFFPDRAGNMNGLYPSGNWLSGAQLDRLQGMCDRYVNSVWFSGHSHWEWCLQKYQDRANIYRGYVGMLPSSGWCVHVPSCGVPRTSNGSSRSDVPAASEGALVEVYKDHIDLRGVELISGKLLPIATYRLDTTPRTIDADGKTRRNYYLSASDFMVNPSKTGATVSDVAGMENYVEVVFTAKGQGFYVANDTYTTSATKVSITVEDVQAFTEGRVIDVPANVGFYGGSYYMSSTNAATIVSGSGYWGVQFQTSASKYGDGPLPLTLRMKVMMNFME